jgi:hypothetical protein
MSGRRVYLSSESFSDEILRLIVGEAEGRRVKRIRRREV